MFTYYDLFFSPPQNLIESFAKLDFWFKSRLMEFQKRSLLVVNEAFEIFSNEELGQKAGFQRILNNLFCGGFCVQRNPIVHSTFYFYSNV
ncbi:MAG: hypothetical protein AAF620_10390 [Bacteroidota bacterium]